jgi:hypothetical protein
VRREEQIARLDHGKLFGQLGVEAVERPGAMGQQLARVAVSLSLVR